MVGLKNRRPRLVVSESIWSMPIRAPARMAAHSEARSMVIQPAALALVKEVAGEVRAVVVVVKAVEAKAVEDKVVEVVVMGHQDLSHPE